MFINKRHFRNFGTICYMVAVNPRIRRVACVVNDVDIPMCECTTPSD